MKTIRKRPTSERERGRSAWALLIINPKSGLLSNRGQPLEDIIALLGAHGIKAEPRTARSAAGTRRLAKQAAQEGRELIIVEGGDGTIEDAASQLVNSPSTLGIIPSGTMNNIARSLGVPLAVKDACALLGMGVARRLDVGRAVTRARVDQQYFLETAGVGLSAVVILAGDAAKSGRWQDLPDALRKLFSIKPQPIEINLDGGRRLSVITQAITLSNAPLIGNNILIAPDAKMDDGLLDVAIYEGMNKAELLAHFVAAANGNRVENPKIKIYRSRRIRIQSPEPVAVHSDKDSIEPNGALEIELLPASLSAIVGKGIALTRPVVAAPSVPPLAGPHVEGKE